MALDTTLGSATQEAYASVEELKKYASDRDIAILDASGTAITSSGTLEAGLRNGTDFMGQFALRLPGARATNTQALDWPRSSASYRDGTGIAADALPIEVKQANCEAAIQYLADPAGFRAAASNRQTKKEKAGDLEVEYFEADGVAQVRTTYTTLEDLLGRILLDPVTQGSGSTAENTAFFIAGRPRQEAGS